MEIPSKVSVYNQTLELKGTRGTLIDINELGYYEVNLQVQDGKSHTVLLPVDDTVVVFVDPLPVIAADFEVER